MTIAPYCTLAGTDMALAFVTKYNGEHAAEEVAGFLEYTGDFRSVLQPNTLFHLSCPLKASQVE